MNHQKTIKALVFIGTILFHLLFWKEKLGINLLIFVIYILTTYFIIFDKKEISKEAVFTSICTFLMATMVLINNSILSVVMFSISFLSMIGFIHQKELKFFFYGAFQSLLHLEAIPKNVFGKKDNVEQARSNWRRGLVYARITTLPIIVLGVFYILYYAANPKFANFSDQTWAIVFNFFNWDISFESILFFIFGFLIVGITIWKTSIPHLVRLNNHHSEVLIRTRKKREFPILNPKMLTLKKEFQTAVVMMVMLNLLLLLVNIVDIRFVWFDFEEQPAYSLKNYVHEGTYLLIASIILAMSIIIYYFRGNLNFYSKNKILQNLTYAWIFQNAILAYSVGMRNFRYIEYHGLAYKRIGVMIFLLAVIFGLITMFKKVQEQRSFYYLVNRNAWAVYVLLCLASLINWDATITKYNILANTKRPIDIEFLTINVSDKNLYLLKKYKDEIVKKLPKNYSPAKFNQQYYKKLKRFEARTSKYSWLSWNYADFRNKKMLLN